MSAAAPLRSSMSVKSVMAAVRFVGLALLPVALTALVFVAVLASGPVPFPRQAIPHEAFVPDRCTWACHNRGCRHRPRLGEWLGGDRGLFGKTIGLLHQAGERLVPGRPGEGYGLANLLVFCLVWPAAMWGLYIVALRQRLALRDRRRGR